MDFNQIKSRIISRKPTNSIVMSNNEIENRSNSSKNGDKSLDSH